MSFGPPLTANIALLCLPTSYLLHLWPDLPNIILMFFSTIVVYLSVLKVKFVIITIITGYPPCHPTHLGPNPPVLCSCFGTPSPPTPPTPPPPFARNRIQICSTGRTAAAGQKPMFVWQRNSRLWTRAAHNLLASKQRPERWWFLREEKKEI